MSEPESYAGETPFLIEACEATGIDPARRSRLIHGRILRALAQQVSQAHHAHRTHLAGDGEAERLALAEVAGVAAGLHRELRAAELAGRLMVAHLYEAIGLPLPGTEPGADPAAGTEPGAEPKPAKGRPKPGSEPAATEAE